MRIGQREVSALVFLVVMVFAVITGNTPENTLDLIGQIVIPLAAAAASFKFLADAINQRVLQGLLTPGSFSELLRMRETWIAVITLIVSAVTAAGWVTLSATQSAELVNSATSIVVVILSLLQRELVERPSRTLFIEAQVVGVLTHEHTHVGDDVR